MDHKSVDCCKQLESIKAQMHYQEREMEWERARSWGGGDERGGEEDKRRQKK